MDALDKHPIASRLSSTASELSGAARRLGEVRDHVDLDIEVEPIVHKAQLGFWQVVGAIGGALLTIPRVLVRALALLSSSVDEVLTRSADVGADLAERTREVAAAVPPSRRDRRQDRLRAAGFIGAGFGVGFLAGWIVGRRGEASEMFDELPPIDTVATPATGEPPSTGGSAATGGSTATGGSPESAVHRAEVTQARNGDAGSPGGTGTPGMPGMPGPLT